MSGHARRTFGVEKWSDTSLIAMRAPKARQHFAIASAGATVLFRPRISALCIALSMDLRIGAAAGRVALRVPKLMILNALPMEDRP